MNLTYEKITEGFVGALIVDRHQAHTLKAQVQTITKSILENAVHEQFTEMTTNIEKLDQKIWRL